MATNAIDVGALQGTAKQDLGAMQGTTNQSISETIVLGSSDHVGFTNLVSAAAAIAPGVSVDNTPATTVSGINAITLGVGGHLGFIMHASSGDAIAMGVSSGITAIADVGAVAAIALGVDDLAAILLIIVDETITLGTFAGFSIDEAVPIPDSFRPFSISGQPGVFKGDTVIGTPGSFKPASGISAPGFFKPKA